MTKTLASFIDDEELAYLQRFLFQLSAPESKILLHNDIQLAFQEFEEEEADLPILSSSWS